MSNQNRVQRGVPSGGQFAKSARPETDTNLDEWLPPGAHQIVSCRHCDDGCDYCTNGLVTTDRYGQYPWQPDVPGTEVGFEVTRGNDRGWHTATILGSSDALHHRRVGGPPQFAPADVAGQARDLRVEFLVPAAVAAAAARHGLTRPELLAEARSEMHIGVAPTEAETLAFLARIDEAYVDDIARSAVDYKRHQSEALREDGLAGPGLDSSFDVASLPPGSLDAAVNRARRDSLVFQFETRGRDSWRGYTVVADGPWEGHTVPSEADGRLYIYRDDAWDAEPSPPGSPVAHVDLDGTVTRSDDA